MKRWASLGLTLLFYGFFGLLIWALLTILTGCGLVQPQTEQPAEPDFTVAILADRRKVWADASEFVERYGDDCRFFWDWGDGSGFAEGHPVEYHTYQVEGDYVIRLKVELGSGAEGGLPGGPGAPPGAPPGGGTSPRRVMWRSKRVNLLDLGYPVPIVAVLNHNLDEPENGIYLPFDILLDASRSYSPDGRPLWFRWEVVYVDPTTKQPAPYPFQGCIQCPTKPEFMRFEGARVRIKWLPCSSCVVPALPWEYRIRCWVSDDRGRVRMWEGYIKVSAC